MNQSEPPNVGAVPQALPHASWVRWHIVGLLIAYSFMTWFNRVSMAAAYDEQIKAQTEISAEQMGYVYSAFLFTYMVFMTPGGWLIDRYGAWAALAVMGVGSGLFGALSGAVGYPWLVAAGLLWPMLLAIRSLMGILTAPVYPASSRLIADWIPVSQRGWANGLIQAAAAVGISCTFPVFGALMDRVGWPGAFVITGTFTLLLALAWTAYATSHPAQHRGVNSGERGLIQTGGPTAGTTPLADPAWWTLLADRSLMVLTLSYATINYVEYLFFFWIHYYFEDVLHLGKTESRIYAAVLTLALAVGMVLGGWAQDRMRVHFRGRVGLVMVPAAGTCAGGILLLLGIRAEQTMWIVVWLALALAAVGMSEAPTWTAAVELGRCRGGTAAAICNTGGNLGGLLAPVITPALSGWISRHYELTESAGWQWGISLGSAIALLGALLWCLVTAPES